MKKLLTVGLTCLATSGLAQEIMTYPFDGDLDDADFVVSSAIQDAGLVIDYVSNVGAMLARTGADLGLGASPVGEGAKTYLFCSATVSREVMEVDPMNIAYCPYAVFIAEFEGQTVVGHRTYPGDSMEPVNRLLIEIATSATE